MTAHFFNISEDTCGGFCGICCTHSWDEAAEICQRPRCCDQFVDIFFDLARRAEVPSFHGLKLISLWTLIPEGAGWWNRSRLTVSLKSSSTHKLGVAAGAEGEISRTWFKPLNLALMMLMHKGTMSVLSPVIMEHRCKMLVQIQNLLTSQIIHCADLFHYSIVCWGGHTCIYWLIWPQLK